MDGTSFVIGASAECADGECGEVTQVVVDPVGRAVTHLVVEPRHRQGLGRLVPLDLVEAASGDVRLRCTTAEFERLDSAEETQFLPGSEEFEGYEPSEVLNWPYYGGNLSTPVTFDTLPAGEVAVRRGDSVHATDGTIGQVQGLVVDRGSGRVSHVLLQEGHLWGRKEVAIPIAAVTGVDDGIQLNLSKHQVQELPPVDVDRGGR
jgi:sporulation protein YlmC with PRC-barrel domain